MIENIATAFLLAVFVEGFIEYFIPKQDEKLPPREWIKYVSALLGIAVAFAYELDIFALLGVTAVFPYIGYVISGIIIGRGSNYLNQFLGKVGGRDTATVSLPKDSNASAEVRVSDAG